MFGGRPCFRRIDSAFFLWWDSSGEAWILNDQLGVMGSDYWHRAFPDIIGEYTAEGINTGVATVALGTHL